MTAKACRCRPVEEAGLTAFICFRYLIGCFQIKAMMNLPQIYRIRQHFDDTRVSDLRAAVHAELNGLGWDQIKPGDRVAITAGSRGIANIADILKAVIDFFRSLDARPFIFPAMGSHGGATAEGQTAVLAQLGVTDTYLQAPILSSMDVGALLDGRGLFHRQQFLLLNYLVQMS